MSFPQDVEVGGVRPEYPLAGRGGERGDGRLTRRLVRLTVALAGVTAYDMLLRLSGN